MHECLLPPSISEYSSIRLSLQQQTRQKQQQQKMERHLEQQDKKQQSRRQPTRSDKPYREVILNIRFIRKKYTTGGESVACPRNPANVPMPIDIYPATNLTKSFLHKVKLFHPSF